MSTVVSKRIYPSGKGSPILRYIHVCQHSIFYSAYAGTDVYNGPHKREDGFEKSTSSPAKEDVSF